MQQRDTQEVLAVSGGVIRVGMPPPVTMPAPMPIDSIP